MTCFPKKYILLNQEQEKHEMSFFLSFFLESQGGIVVISESKNIKIQ